MLRANSLKITRCFSLSNCHKSRILTSEEIRKRFTDYFVEHDHTIVKSSPVIPFCDPTVAFVNAGMNQFKSIFLGKTKPAFRRVTNSQKCVRVGGKHNDLSIVGRDGYHHTFFEMLGNWSFGDYYKREACEMAINLLREQYGLDTSRLYVTYFGGDSKIGIGPDLECKDIWKSLGFPENRIIPFGCKDNFWEMGSTGPCGPCTEIHYDHNPNLGANRVSLVNGGWSDLTEIWNIVFIQYDRKEDGTIALLPEKHVDTGMGFERLTAILQNKLSNYDTDIFTPIFDHIQKITKVPHYSGEFCKINASNELDTAYRILADHSRMITACISDGMLPDQNQKLRRVLRKVLLLSENIFKNNNLLLEVIPKVVEILGPTYPEMSLKLNDVRAIISHEQDVFKVLRETSSKASQELLSRYPDLDDIDLIYSPGFVPAFKELEIHKKNFENKLIPGNLLYKLSDTFGLDIDSIQKLAELQNLQVDKDDFHAEMFKVKEKLKRTISSNSFNVQKAEEMLSLITRKCSDTDNSSKYIYKFNNITNLYEVPAVEAIILAILENDLEVLNINSDNVDNVYSIITNKSNFYYESGGQQSDKGYINSLNGQEFNFNVEHVYCMNDCIVHVGKFQKMVTNNPKTLNVKDRVMLNVNSHHRTKNTMHHTGTHLINAAIRALYNKVTYQISSSVTFDNLRLELGIIGKRIAKQEIIEIENLISDVINSSVTTQLKIINSTDVSKISNITLVPGEIYPETNLRLLTIENQKLKFNSNELCCGTHVHNTSEIQHFCITNLKQTNRARYAFFAIAGDSAEDALNRAKSLVHRIDRLEEEFNTDADIHYTIDVELQKIRATILQSNTVLPYVFKLGILERINIILKKLKEGSRTSIKEFVEHEMNSVLQEKSKDQYPFIIHYLSCSALMDAVPLQKATKLCPDRPIIVVSMSDGMIKARCHIPTNKISDNFTAQKWLNEFASVFQAKISSPKGKNPLEICNMKEKRISSGFDEKLELAIQKASAYALNFL